MFDLEPKRYSVFFFNFPGQSIEISACARMDIPEHRLSRSGNLFIADLPKSEPGRQIPVEFTGSHRGYKTGKFKRMVGCDPHKGCYEAFLHVKSGIVQNDRA